jgi:hypothetical protein
MKTLAPSVQVIEVANEGLPSLLGKVITCKCVNYIYTGKLEGVNDKFLKLSDASVVFETGPYHDAKWKDAQKLPGDGVAYLMLHAIEYFGVMK